MKIVYVAAMLVALLFSNKAGAVEYVVKGAEANGGRASFFLGSIAEYRKKGIRVVLSGTCISSCTLYTALLRDNLVCATPGTKLLFHQYFHVKNEQVDAQGRMVSFDLDRYVEGTERQRIWMKYPRNVRQAILARSPGLPALGKELSITAQELNIPRC